MITALEGGEGSASRPGRSLPPGKIRYPLYRRLGCPQGRSKTGAENLAPPPGFDPRTVQPVASRYTDYATRPTSQRDRNLITAERTSNLLSGECRVVLKRTDIGSDCKENLRRLWK